MFPWQKLDVSAIPRVRAALHRLTLGDRSDDAVAPVWQMYRDWSRRLEEASSKQPSPAPLTPKLPMVVPPPRSWRQLSFGNMPTLLNVEDADRALRRLCGEGPHPDAARYLFTVFDHWEKLVAQSAPKPALVPAPQPAPTLLPRRQSCIVEDDDIFASEPPDFLRRAPASGQAKSTSSNTSTRSSTSACTVATPRRPFNYEYELRRIVGTTREDRLRPLLVLRETGTLSHPELAMFDRALSQRDAVMRADFVELMQMFTRMCLVWTSSGFRPGTNSVSFEGKIVASGRSWEVLFTIGKQHVEVTVRISWAARRARPTKMVFDRFNEDAQWHGIIAVGYGRVSNLKWTAHGAPLPRGEAERGLLRLLRIAPKLMRALEQAHTRYAEWDAALAATRRQPTRKRVTLH